MVKPALPAATCAGESALRAGISPPPTLIGRIGIMGSSARERDTTKVRKTNKMHRFVTGTLLNWLVIGLHRYSLGALSHSLSPLPYCDQIPRVLFAKSKRWQRKSDVYMSSRNDHAHADSGAGLHHETDRESCWLGGERGMAGGAAGAGDRRAQRPRESFTSTNLCPGFNLPGKSGRLSQDTPPHISGKAPLF